MKRPVKRHKVCQPRNKPYRYISLTQGRTTIVDAADFEWLNQWNWNAVKVKNGKYVYVGRIGPDRNYIFMHRIILSCKRMVDHKNHDTLDNRRDNLREASRSQNGCNRELPAGDYRGVYYKVGKWEASITRNGVYRYLGRFNSVHEAIRVRDKAAKKYHGEFAVLNLHQ
jgi:hypothetical protein